MKSLQKKQLFLFDAVEAISAVWHGVGATRDEQRSQNADSDLEMLDDHRLSGSAQKQSLAEAECALRDSMMEKRCEGQTIRNEQFCEHLWPRYSAEYNAYVSTEWPQWRHPDIHNCAALTDREPGLVQSAIARLLNGSNAPSS